MIYTGIDTMSLVLCVRDVFLTHKGNSNMYTLIIYKRKVNGSEYWNAYVISKSDRPIVEKRLYRNLSVSCISSCNYASLDQARHVLERFRQARGLIAAQGVI